MTLSRRAFIATAAFVLAGALKAEADKFRVPAGWIPASLVLGPDDRLAEWAPLAASGIKLAAIMPNGTFVISPVLAQMDRAMRFKQHPWGKVLISEDFAHVIIAWRARHPELVPNPM